MSRQGHNYASILGRSNCIGDQESRGGMRGLSNRTIERLWACLALLGGVAAGSWAAGVVARPQQPPASPAAVIAAMSPADVVSLRFPASWEEEAVAEPAAPARMVLASADDGMSLFSPQPMYPVALQPDPSAHARPLAAAEVAPAGAAAAPAKVALAAAPSKPAPARATHRSNAVLSDSQIASIRRRLNLTPEQARYWPAVEAELRKMEYQRDAHGKSTQGTRMASVDLSKVNVEGLKSAGFPLVMSFSDDQRRELKSLAHLLGLESVMSGL